MKKLLFIALLMLALVVTAVACSDDKPADTTSGETTAAPAPGETTAEPDADTTAEPAPETTVAPAPETTAAPAPETTAAPEETTKEVTTEEVTTADPADPIGVYEADKISTIVGGDPSNITQDCVSLEDGYLHVVPIGADPYWYPFANVKGARFVSIRYRTDATGADIQMYIGSTGAGPSNDDSMLRQPVVADGEWHLAIFDTQEIIDKGLYDGSTVSYFRFDALEAGYKLDENGEKYYIEGTETWARYTLPENCYIDVEYIAFFNTAEYAAAYDFAKNPPYVAPDAAGKVGVSYDSFWVNGQDYYNTAATGQVNLKLDEANNTIAFDAGAARETVMLRGWAGFNQPIASYGYFVDNYSMVYGEFTVEAEGPVKDPANGGEHATRYEITIPVADLEPGVHTVGFVVKLEDGTVVLLHKEIKIVVVPTYTEKTVTLGIRNSDTPFTGSEKKFGQRFQVTEGFVIGITIDAMATYDDGNVNKWAFKVWQWKGNYADTVAGTPLFATTGENHANCQAFTVAIPATAYVTGDIFYEIEYVEGTKSFTGWTAGDLYTGIESYVDGALKDGGYSASMIVGVAFEGEFVEGDASNVFASDINANTAGTDLKTSDLGGYFAADYGAGARHTVIDKDGTLLYNIGDFNALSTKPNGKYAFTVKNLYTENPGFSGIFVRALRKATVEGQFYGADGNDADVNSYGGSGIYIAMLDETTLRINVKSYVDGKYVPNIYTVTVASNDITVVDDGATVYVLAGDALVATIAINGTNDYGIAGVAADHASVSATLTIGGETYEIANAILAAACNVENSIGLATRGGGNMTFSEVIIAGFSTVTIPGVGEPEAPADPETPVVENLTIDLTAVTPETGAAFQPSWPDAGFNAPIIQMMNWGSAINLGEIDLSKYSAVVVSYGSDAGAKQGDVGTFMALTKNGAVENADSSDKTDAEIIGQATMSNATGFWNVTRDVTIEFDTDYNGVVYLAQDMKDGNGIAIASIVFIAK